MRTFIIIWLGQLASNIGSYMTHFAIKIWAWELTNQVTTIALFSVFEIIPSILITLISGSIVDRVNRKFLLIISDSISAISTLIIGYLYFTNQLQIWHIYATGALNGTFAEVQSLAYSSSISMLVPKQDYMKATSMNSAIHYSSVIIAPALAGLLYYLVGLGGILCIDFVSFIIGIVTVFQVHIPQPKPTVNSPENVRIWEDIIFGFRYLMARPSLFAMIIVDSLFWFVHDIGATLYSPMILTRTKNDTKVLGTISSAAGLGGLIGTLLLSIWGRSKGRVHGFLLGMIGAGVSKSIFGLGRGLVVWLPAQFCSSLNFPMLTSSSTAILLSKVRPDIQGRIFATQSSLQQIASAIAVFAAAWLSDGVFEPGMTQGGNLSYFFGSIFGTDKGSGMALLCVISSLGLLLVGLFGYAFPSLRNVEKIVPDYDAEYK